VEVDCGRSDECLVTKDSGLCKRCQREAPIPGDFASFAIDQAQKQVKSVMDK